MTGMTAAAGPVSPAHAASTSIKGLTLDQARWLIVDQTNAERVKASLPQVTLSADVTVVAQASADWHAQRDTFEITHRTMSDLGSRLPAGWSRISENIAINQVPASTVQQWMESASHRANILDPDVNTVGIGVACGASGYCYYVQNFAGYPTPPNPMARPVERLSAGVDRVAGTDRYATSIEISRRHAGKAPVVYLANGYSFPDALSAAPAAAHQNGVVLLTPQNELRADTAAEIDRLAPARIVIAGSEKQVSSGVEATLKARYRVDRMSGGDRYETSSLINRDAWPTGSSRMYVATGANFPDAMTASAVAAASDSPVQLTSIAAAGYADVNRNLIQAYAALAPSTVIVAGSASAVDLTTSSYLEGTPVGGHLPTVTRLGGANRFDTAAKLVRSQFGSSSTAVLASGFDFPDALSAAAVFGRTMPVLLATPTCLPSETFTELQREGASQVTILGGVGTLGVGVARLERCW